MLKSEENKYYDIFEAISALRKEKDNLRWHPFYWTRWVRYYKYKNKLSKFIKQYVSETPLNLKNLRKYQKAFKIHYNEIDNVLKLKRKPIGEVIQIADIEKINEFSNINVYVHQSWRIEKYIVRIIQNTLYIEGDDFYYIETDDNETIDDFMLDGKYMVINQMKRDMIKIYLDYLNSKKIIPKTHSRV